MFAAAAGLPCLDHRPIRGGVAGSPSGGRRPRSSWPRGQSSPWRHPALRGRTLRRAARSVSTPSGAGVSSAVFWACLSPRSAPSRKQSRALTYRNRAGARNGHSGEERWLAVELLNTMIPNDRYVSPDPFGRGTGMGQHSSGNKSPGAAVGVAGLIATGNPGGTHRQHRDESVRRGERQPRALFPLVRLPRMSPKSGDCSTWSRAKTGHRER